MRRLVFLVPTTLPVFLSDRSRAKGVEGSTVVLAIVSLAPPQTLGAPCLDFQTGDTSNSNTSTFAIRAVYPEEDRSGSNPSPLLCRRSLRFIQGGFDGSFSSHRTILQSVRNAILSGNHHERHPAIRRALAERPLHLPPTAAIPRIRNHRGAGISARRRAECGHLQHHLGHVLRDVSLPSRGTAGRGVDPPQGRARTHLLRGLRTLRCREPLLSAPRF